jgi:hypothetical protein
VSKWVCIGKNWAKKEKQLFDKPEQLKLRFLTLFKRFSAGEADY